MLRNGATQMYENFEKYFQINVQNVEKQDQYVYRHPNGFVIWCCFCNFIIVFAKRICVVGIAPSHIVLEKLGNNYEIVDIEYTQQVKNLIQEKSSKSKKQQKQVKPLDKNTILCYISLQEKETKTIEKFPLYSCIRGKLIELNDRLLQNPSNSQMISTTHCIGGGYIAIIDSNTKANYYSKKATNEVEEANLLSLNQFLDARKELVNKL